MPNGMIRMIKSLHKVTFFLWTKSNQFLIQKTSLKRAFARFHRGRVQIHPHALTENTWVRDLLHELHVTISLTPTIYCDNFGVTYLSHNPCFILREY